MANVRYMGGSSATLGTKEINENGVYNASSDDLDGYSSVTVDVPAPSGSVSLEYTGNGQYSEDVSQYASAEITVDVPIPTVNTQTKSITASTSQQTVTPDPGYFLEQVTVNPQQNTATYTPAANTPNNDMGTVNNYRYVNTSGMVSPTGVKSISIESNGTYTEDITNNKYVDIDVNVPVSGDLGTKTIITNGIYQALDDNLDGYSEVTVNVPQNATLGIKTITTNGNYNAITDGYDGYSRVDVSVAGSTLQANKNVTATTSQQIVTPDLGYDALEQVTVNPQVHTQTYTPAQNTAANDMGEQNNYRYVNTSGMVVPGSVTPSNSTPAALTNGSAVTPTANGYAISSLTDVIPDNDYPVTLYEGDIYRITFRDGVLIREFYSKTPSDVTPATIVNGEIFRSTGNGYLYATQQTAPTSITPSNTTPVALTANNPVNPTSNGYAIASYSSKTPDDTTPPAVASGDIVKMGGAGYLYQTIQSGTPVKTGTFTTSTTATITVNCGFQPKYLAIEMDGNTSSAKHAMYIYNYDTSSNSYYRANQANYPTTYTLPQTADNLIGSITSTGFTMTKTSPARTCRYFAIG